MVHILVPGPPGMGQLGLPAGVHAVAGVPGAVAPQHTLQVHQPGPSLIAAPPGAFLAHPGLVPMPVAAPSLHDHRHMSGLGAIEPMDDKKLKRMRRNRESAAQSRNRKKQYVDTLEAEIKSLRQTINELYQENYELRVDHARVTGAPIPAPPRFISPNVSSRLEEDHDAPAPAASHISWAPTQRSLGGAPAGSEPPDGTYTYQRPANNGYPMASSAGGEAATTALQAASGAAPAPVPSGGNTGGTSKSESPPPTL